MQSPPFPRYLVPPRSKYSPQHHVLEHPRLPFLPRCQRPSFTPIQNKRQNYSSIYLDLNIYIYIYIYVCVCVYIYIYIYIYILDTFLPPNHLRHLKMDAARPSETPEQTYYHAQCKNPRNYHSRNIRSEGLKINSNSG